MDYNELGNKLKGILKLENDPVAIKWSVKEPRNVEKEEGKSRFCAKLDKAMHGETSMQLLKKRNVWAVQDILD
jgi:uncharacterized protein (DUF169 family)